MEKLKYTKVREVKDPVRANPTDAGIDFFIPKMYDDTPLIVEPNKGVLIPSGIKVEIPHGYMGLFLNKSGIATRHKLLVGAQVIDTGYAGEVHINLHNVGKDPVILSAGQKICQMVLIPISACMPVNTELADMSFAGSRGSGGFGSSGTH